MYVGKKYYLCGVKKTMLQNILFMANKDLNRLKVVLAEKKKTGKWLAEQLGKDQTTISKWCTNSSQPDIENFMKVAEILNVDINDLLIRKNKE